ncbi:hydrolase [Chlamydia crocodili]|uniref:Hydrolase n=1 Tax=Chlamydia crocodili TaxID=2766982 RepID=A0ABX8CD65_9CHLA|nr:hydrolase [Chlamydia crocodili]QVE48958.1 hydrolase [Chlamydia crocodili]
MKNTIKDIKAQNSGKAIPDDQIQFSCGGDGVTENAMRKPWNVSNQRITNIARGSGNPASGSIALKGDLSDYLQKGGVTTRGIFLRTTGGLMIGDINMGSTHTIVGLPTSYKTTVVNDNDIASVGMVSEDIGSLAAKVTDLIDRINNLSSADGLDKIIKDLGTPSNGTVTKPSEAKWLVRAGGNSMTGNLGFKKSEQSTPTDPEPTIKNLAITGSIASGVSAVGAISTGTTKENLQRIVAVNDLTETLDTISKNNTSYPKWTGMDVSFVCLKQGANSSSSTPNYTKSQNSEKYITSTSETSATLLRRGIYCVSFIYDFTQPTPPTTPPGTPTPATDVSCTLSLTPKSGTKTECYKLTGKSDTTLIGKTYIFVEGNQASIETTLSFEVTSTPSVAKRTWAVSFVGAAY